MLAASLPLPIVKEEHPELGGWRLGGGGEAGTRLKLLDFGPDDSGRNRAAPHNWAAGHSVVNCPPKDAFFFVFFVFFPNFSHSGNNLMTFLTLNSYHT